MQSTTVKSAYIHIPFCKNICTYCDFCKNFYNENIVNNYLGSLEKEIETSYKEEILDTLYIGGGTPSSLSSSNLNKLFNIIKKFKLSKTYEFTFECNYDDITEELLILLKQNRINRLSIGIQTFNDKYQDILNRKINKKEMIDTINLSKKYFDNINIDLMYALPKESIKDLENDSNIFIDLDIKHISTYALIIEEHTKLGLSDIKEIDEDTQNDMYYRIIDKLKDNGYNHYELSNFSKEGFSSKHNLTYWNNEQYYGFGAGASGFIKGVRYDNTKSIMNYINGKRLVYEEVIEKQQMIKDEIMLGFRKTNGINKKDFKDKYKMELKDVFNINEMIKDGLLKETPLNVFISPEYLFVSNEIILKVISNCNLN